MQQRTRSNILLVLSIAVALVFVSISCTTTSKPTVAEAEKFIADTENLLQDLSVKAGRAHGCRQTSSRMTRKPSPRRQTRILSRPQPSSRGREAF